MLVNNAIKRILPKDVAESLLSQGSRLAHLYGLPKTHKKNLSVRPILSATGTYNFQLAKWLDEKLKPLSLNHHTITDVFEFAEEVTQLDFNENDILVSYDVTSLFTNVPLDETIEILATKAFRDNWFNKTNNLNITKSDLIELLELATKHQLFQYNGELYEQKDGVGMGSPLGPLMANAFLCHIEEHLDLPDYYRRYVDDTITVMSCESAAHVFLDELNSIHPSLHFTMEIATNGKLPFLGMLLDKNGPRISTCVYRKPTDKGLLLHYHSHVDHRYKTGLLTTMLNRAYRLSSSWQLFSDECEKLKNIFKRLKYPEDLINRTVKNFVDYVQSDAQKPPQAQYQGKTVRIVLPYKDQKSANVLRRRLKDLSVKIGNTIEIVPVFINRKIESHLKHRENKPNVVNNQCVVYYFKCGLCDMDYIGYTTRHLHQRIEEHKSLSSSVGRHMKTKHDLDKPELKAHFTILKKCKSKFDCLVHEMLLIRERQPSLNKQSDSIRAKVFV